MCSSIMRSLSDVLIIKHYLQRELWEFKRLNIDLTTGTVAADIADCLKILKIIQCLV